MAEPLIIRRQYSFRGWVQGVGFRYISKNAADAVGATGWVRNEYNGSVTMVIQGTVDQIHQALQIIQNARYIRIEQVDYRELKPEKNEKQFQIRY